MIFTAPIIHRKADGERLHIIRLGVCLGVGLAGLCHGFRADHVVGLREWEQIAQLGRVGKIGRVQHDFLAVRNVCHSHSAHAIAVYICARGLVVQQHPYLSGVHIRRQHILQHSQCNARFTADA